MIYPLKLTALRIANTVKVMLVFSDDEIWPGMFVPPNDREGTIEGTAGRRFSAGAKVDKCPPGVPLIRYFEDGS